MRLLLNLATCLTPCQAKSFASAQGNKMKSNLSPLPHNSRFRLWSINSCPTGWMPYTCSIVPPLRKFLADRSFGASLSKSRQHRMHQWGSVKSDNAYSGIILVCYDDVDKVQRKGRSHLIPLLVTTHPRPLVFVSKMTSLHYKAYSEVIRLLDLKAN